MLEPRNRPRTVIILGDGDVNVQNNMRADGSHVYFEFNNGFNGPPCPQCGGFHNEPVILGFARKDVLRQFIADCKDLLAAFDGEFERQPFSDLTPTKN